MIAKSFLSALIPSIKSSETAEKALMWMADFHVQHLPVVEDGHFLGVISEDDIYELSKPEVTIAEHSYSNKNSFVNEYEHVYEIVKMAVRHQLTLVPVIDDNEVYLGAITQEALLAYFAQATSINEPGSILVLEVSERNYSLAEIARLAEYEQATILSSNVTSQPNSILMEITLKFNTREVGRLVATYERFNYTVKASFQESDYMEDYQDRYDSLMSYLSI
jgi:acetoin utilization protein AcuB